MKTKFVFVVVCLIVVSLFSGCSSSPTAEIPVTGNNPRIAEAARSLHVGENVLEFIDMKSDMSAYIPEMDMWALTIQADEGEDSPAKFIYTNGGWEMIIKQSAANPDQYLITITNEEEKFSWLGFTDKQGNIIDLTPRESRFTKKDFSATQSVP